MAVINGTSGNDFVHMAGDGLMAPAGFNEIAEATNDSDSYYGETGGNDRVYLGNGNDYFFFDGGFTAADRLDGGIGYDYLYLYRPATIAFASQTIRNIEAIYLNGTYGPGAFDLTLHDANIAAGAFFTISASDLASDNPVRADLSAETDASYIYFYGGSGNDTVLGGSEPDYLYGYGGNDSLVGGEGNDALYGHAGLDTLVGGNGSDYYYSADGDVIVEEMDGGYDYLYSYAPNTVLPLNVEALYLQGDQPINGTGNAQNNLLNGNDGDNRLLGGGGTDYLYGNQGDDLLEGEGGSDTMYGGMGNDTLIGGGGADYLQGGQGDDTYINPTGDIINEYTREGTDTVESNATFSLETYVNLENLTLTGNAASEGTGNDVANKLTGNNSSNRLSGLGGNDTIKGGGGGDSLIGGDGNDQLAGEDGDDSLAGGAGADTLVGGGGNDTMNGGANADLFRFSASNTGDDLINGFSTMQDRFDLSGGTFSARAIDGADTVLTHAGGTIRVAGVNTLNLNQWNALVDPAPAAAIGASSLDVAFGHHHDHVRLPDGDWLLA
jgi:Ca2+-binding RTX toxin-like protein